MSSSSTKTKNRSKAMWLLMIGFVLIILWLLWEHFAVVEAYNNLVDVINNQCLCSGVIPT